jgi:DNA polymerase-4
VVRPGDGAAFVAALPVRRFHGIGPRGAEKMAALGINTGADLRTRDLTFLRANFGAMADYLYRAARGIDLRAVSAHRGRKSVSAERTFDHDLSSGPVLREALENIADAAWERIERSTAKGRTVTLKLRLADFQTLTRARSLPAAVESRRDFGRVGMALLETLLPLPQPVRLMGLGLSSLAGEEGDEAPASQPGEGGQLSLF